MKNIENQIFMNNLYINLYTIILNDAQTAKENWQEIYCSGERGIRTLDTLLEYTHFPGVLLRPLGHLSV
jgi:hypothetical protein